MERSADRMLAQNGNHLRHNWDARTSAGAVLLSLKQSRETPGHLVKLQVMIQ